MQHPAIGHAHAKRPVTFREMRTLGMAEQLTANLIHTQGTDYGRLALTLPAGYGGWRVGANASTLAYRLIAPEFSALDVRGTSSTVGLEASYPLIRSRLKNLYLGLNYDTKRFDNQSGGATTTRYQIAAFSASLNGNLFDSLGGGGATVNRNNGFIGASPLNAYTLLLSCCLFYVSPALLFRCVSPRSGVKR